MVAVNANPRYITPDYLAAFDQQEGLEHVPNWLYLTGSLSRTAPRLEVVRRGGHLPARRGHDRPQRVRLGHRQLRAYPGHLDTDPGPATSATESSFAVMLANAIKDGPQTGK